MKKKFSQYLRLVCAVPGVCLVLLMMLCADVYCRVWVRRLDSSGKYQQALFLWQGVWKLLAASFKINFTFDPGLTSLAARRGGLIVAANHNSPLDWLLITIAFAPHRVSFVSRPGLSAGVPLLNVTFPWSASIELSSDARENIRRLQHLGDVLRKEGGIVVIFPEGQKTAQNYQQFGKFNPAGLRILAKAAPDALVLPVVVLGAQQAWCHTRSLPRPGATIKLILADRRNAVEEGMQNDISLRVNTSIFEQQIRAQLDLVSKVT